MSDFCILLNITFVYFNKDAEVFVQILLVYVKCNILTKTTFPGVCSFFKFKETLFKIPVWRKYGPGNKISYCNSRKKPNLIEETHQGIYQFLFAVSVNGKIKRGVGVMQCLAAMGWILGFNENCRKSIWFLWMFFLLICCAQVSVVLLGFTPEVQITILMLPYLPLCDS